MSSPNHDNDDNANNNKRKFSDLFDIENEDLWSVLVNVATGSTSSNKQEEVPWRLDPETTHSDYKIEIRRKSAIINNEQTAVVDTYHVHKAYLAFGDIKSEYFAGLFRTSSSGNMEENSSGVSRIELEDAAAEAFPDFLDIIYTNSITTGSFSDEKLVALYHLGRYFGSQTVSKTMYATLRSRPWSNFKACLESILFFRDEILLKMARMRTTQFFIGQYKSDDYDRKYIASVVAVLDLPFFESVLDAWSEVIAARNRWSKTVDPFPSGVITKYISVHKTSIDQEVFLRLTDRKYMPVVLYPYALKLIKLEAEIVTDKGENEDITCLQKRCVDALMARNSYFKDKKDDFLRVFQLLEKPKLAQLLTYSYAPHEEPPHVPETGPHHIRVIGSQDFDGIYLRDVQGFYYQQELELFIDEYDDTWRLTGRDGPTGVLYELYKHDFEDENDYRNLPPVHKWHKGSDNDSSHLVPLFLFEDHEEDDASHNADNRLGEDHDMGEEAG